MFGLYEKLKNRKGSLTVEAAISLPLAMCVIISIAFFMRVIYVHELVQHAIDDTASEMATYSYLYSVKGLQSAHDEFKDEFSKRKETYEKHATEIFDAYESLNSTKDEVEKAAQDATDTVSGIDPGSLKDIESIRAELKTLAERYDTAVKTGQNAYSTTKEDINKVKGVLSTAIKDPKSEIVSFISVLVDGSFKKLKSVIADPLIRLTIRKHFRTREVQDENKRLAGLNIVGGFEGLDFSQSKLFEDKKSIDIIVRYQVKNVVPINFLPDIYIIQRAKVNAWLDGKSKGAGEGTLEDKQEEENDNLNPWNMESDTERGKVIQTLEGRNLPDFFPRISEFDKASGEAVMVRSINLDAPTYKKPGNLNSKIKGFINDMYEFNGGSSGGTTISKEQIKSKRLVIIVPEGTLKDGTVDPKIVEILDSYENNKDNNKGIIVEVKEAYGRRNVEANADSGG